MAGSNNVVIMAGCRIPIGKFQGSLGDLSATQLGAIAVREAVKRANLQPQQVDECIMGNVVSAGLGQNPARQAALFGGLAPEVGAMTINKVCGSGLKAVALAAQANRDRQQLHRGGRRFACRWQPDKRMSLRKACDFGLAKSSARQGTRADANATTIDVESHLPAPLLRSAP
jgi:hypothetical protein